LKEALLELYLSVKIRSDEEIDNYTEEQFKQEKEMMKDVDGFTLIDYIKSSIEILMNMKIEENENNGKHNDSSKPKRKHDQGGNIERVIPKIDDKTPTSSILDLQKKLD
jgi:hypothetical protein